MMVHRVVFHECYLQTSVAAKNRLKAALPVFQLVLLGMNEFVQKAATQEFAMMAIKSTAATHIE
jgi:hypothetical protein